MGQMKVLPPAADAIQRRSGDTGDAVEFLLVTEEEVGLGAGNGSDANRAVDGSGHDEFSGRIDGNRLYLISVRCNPSKVGRFEIQNSRSEFRDEVACAVGKENETPVRCQIHPWTLWR